MKVFWTFSIHFYLVAKIVLLPPYEKRQVLPLLKFSQQFPPLTIRSNLLNPDELDILHILYISPSHQAVILCFFCLHTDSDLFPPGLEKDSETCSIVFVQQPGREEYARQGISCCMVTGDKTRACFMNASFADTSETCSQRYNSVPLDQRMNSALGLPQCSAFTPVGKDAVCSKSSRKPPSFNSQQQHELRKRRRNTVKMLLKLNTSVLVCGSLMH